MCTVSFIKHTDGFSLTSNRDEQTSRPTLPPKVYDEFDQNLVYPKDEIAGGTWIASSDKRLTVCLLNGAFKNHKRQLPYAKSRGVVLKERFQYNDNHSFINEVNLINVEPFTLLMIDHRDLDNLDFKVLVWDANQKHASSIDTHNHHIWASATLYNDKQREMRQDWFEDFINTHDSFPTDEIIKFHSGSFTDDKSEDMVMARHQELKTISISQINILKDSKCFIYKDLEVQKNHKIKLDHLCQTV